MAWYHSNPSTATVPPLFPSRYTCKTYVLQQGAHSGCITSRGFRITTNVGMKYSSTEQLASTSLYQAKAGINFGLNKTCRTCRRIVYRDYKYKRRALDFHKIWYAYFRLNVNLSIYFSPIFISPDGLNVRICKAHISGLLFVKQMC